MGQFMTPAHVGLLMAQMFNVQYPEIRLLDAGAGIGSLTAAFIQTSVERNSELESISVTAYEVDPLLREYLKQSLSLCGKYCKKHEVNFEFQIGGDFVDDSVKSLQNPILNAETPLFNCAILNPPYRKISSSSQDRLLLNSISAGTSNLYSAFVTLAIRLMEDNGEIVAITPRSFCNGPYFKKFRGFLSRELNLKQIHVFESRKRAFKDDNVLQENIIFHGVKGVGQGSTITITRSNGGEKETANRKIDSAMVISPDDPNLFIHLPVTEQDSLVAGKMSSLPCKLTDLEIEVSTGRVVDFRSRPFLREMPEKNTVPLIYPCHFEKGYIRWPKELSRKPNAIVHCSDTEELIVKTGAYPLVKRFSSKEEHKRVTAALFDSERFSNEFVAFENHVNFFHINGRGLELSFARGLTIFLNSSVVDQYFRQFNGHTQVNATDLRSFRYPSKKDLMRLGNEIFDSEFCQNTIDDLVEPLFQAAISNHSLVLHRSNQHVF